MTRRKRSTTASAKAQKMWKRAGPPHHPVVHGELSSGPTTNSVTKKRSAAAPAAANDEGSDEEDEARLKRLRNLSWPPKSVPSEAGNDEKPAGYFLYPLVTVDLSTNQSPTASAGTKRIIKVYLDRTQWPTPMLKQNLRATAMPWEKHTLTVVDRHMGEKTPSDGGQTHGGEQVLGGGEIPVGGPQQMALMFEMIKAMQQNQAELVESLRQMREGNTNKEDHQNKNDNRNHEERESHNKNDTPFVTMSDVADLLKQERERAPKEPRHFVRRPPYPIELLKEPYPEKYDTPVFALFDGRRGSAMEHISKFLDSMGPFAANGDLCLREFSKSLVDRAYTWYTVLPAGSIRTWEDMVESFCSKYFHVEEKITLVNLHSTKQQVGEDLVKYIHRFRDVSLDCHVKYQEGELVEVCIDNMLPEFRAHLENLDITRFAPLLQKARKTAISVKPQVEKSRDKKSLPQTLTVSTATAPSGTKRKNTTDKVYEEPPPLPFTAEEMMAIFDKWVQDQVIKLPKISKQPTPEEQKDPKYCRYHRYVNHSTVDCRTLRWEVNRKIQNGTLLLSEAQQKVHQTPFPNYNKDKGKAVVSVVIHGNVSDVEAEESAAASSSLVPAAVRTLQRSPKFKSLFNQLGFGPEARNAATEALITIAAESGATCFTAEAHASRAFLETTNAITFTDEDMEVQYPDHRRPLYLSAVIKNVQVRRALVDTGSCLNLIPLSTLQAVDLPHQKIQGSPMEVTGFGGMIEHTMGHVQLVLKVGPIVALTRFHVVNAETPYHVLLGRPWLHKHKLVSSTYHQCVKGRLNGKPIRIAANSCPFDQTEAHFVEAALYDDLASTEEPSIVRPCGTPLPAWEDIKDDPETDLRELLQRKKKRKGREVEQGSAPQLRGGLQPSCHLIQQTENSKEVVVDQLQPITMNSEETRSMAANTRKAANDQAESTTTNPEGSTVDHSPSTVTNSEEEDAVDQTESTARKMKESTTAEPNLTSKEELEVINLSDNPDITKPISISKSLSAKERKCLIDLLHEYKDVFAWDYHEMPGIDPGLVAHSLNVEPGTRPVPIQHPRWLSNIVPVKKKNGQIRCCVDFRNLNKACPKDEFPLPNMDLLIDSAAGHAMFSFMDGFSGYNQIRMSTRDAEKTAFRTPIGNFYYTVMPFGLKNAGATYQRTMTAMFHDMMHKEIEDYVDDIVVKSKKREDHLGILRKVFDRCRLYKLKMNPLKCAFGVSAGKFLGFLVHNRGIDVDPAKASAIATMKAPTSHKELKSFLGRLSYIRRFIPGLDSSNSRVHTSDEERSSFYLSLADHCVYTWLPIVKQLGAWWLKKMKKEPKGQFYYVSRALKDAETRYSGAERACLALIYASQRLRHYFLAHKIQLITKSHPIRSLLHRPVLSGRLAQWLLQLSQYEITTETPTAIKSQAIADLLAQFPGEDSSSISHEVPGEIGEALLADLADSTWTLKFDGSSTSSSSGAGIVLASEDGKTIAKSFKLDFPCSNNASEYEAYITGCENRYADALATLGSQVSFEGSKVDVTIDKRSMPITDLLREKFKEPNLDAEDWRTPIKAKLVAPEGVADLKVLKDYVLIAWGSLPQTAWRSLGKMCEPPRGSKEANRGPREVLNSAHFASTNMSPTRSMQTFVSSDWRTPFLEYLIENILPQTSQAAVRIKKLATRYFVEGGILFRKGFHGDPLRCLSLAESQTVMKEAHSGECGEHQGKKRLYQLLLTLGYYWPTMKKDTADFVKSCHTCQLQANLIHTHPTSLQNMATPWPFHTWGLDLIGPINPASGGYIWILVATEYFSKWVEAIPLRKATGAAVANFIREHIITRFGIPHKIISDNGTPFVNKNAGVLIWQTHYGPTVDQPKTATGFTPFSLVYGTDAISPTELLVPSPRILHGMDLEADADICAEARVADLEGLEEARELAQARSLRYHQKLADAYEKTLQTRIFAKGQDGAENGGPCEKSGYYKLSTADGTTLADPINGKWLKRYYS
uniref:RNA-directed DNA polymerase n=1 Tax=Fagus sylvatica TaxID=28930 RepID=A0A2N9GAK5_FAGSY